MPFSTLVLVLVAEHVRRVRKGADPLSAGQRDQMLEQQCADNAAVHVIGDRQGDLRRLQVAADRGAARRGRPIGWNRPLRAPYPGCAFRWPVMA
jgi:hypothetical protein